MPKGVAGSRMIGSSSRFTNRTCVLGSLPGLAPTTNMRPNITGLAGYKAYPISNNMFRITQSEVSGKSVKSLQLVRNVSECGFNRNCKDSKTCVTKVSAKNIK
tara:strand:+ start:6366 stop:6674 length:309 start_codon:yes stop_codon:yes gene_type:complete